MRSPCKRPQRAYYIVLVISGKAVKYSDQQEALLVRERRSQQKLRRLPLQAGYDFHERAEKRLAIWCNHLEDNLHVLHLATLHTYTLLILEQTSDLSITMQDLCERLFCQDQ